MRGDLIVAVTGASGSVYAQRLIRFLAGTDLRVHWIVSEAATLVIRQELGVSIDPLNPDPTKLIGSPAPQIAGHSCKNFAANISSGTHPTRGMIIVPCTTGTLGSIAAGACRNLIDRAADVTLKEGRPLVCVVRETPLSQIHLENMLRVARAGGTILPANPGFYSGQKTLEDLVDFVVGKILDRMSIENDVMSRWGH